MPESRKNPKPEKWYSKPQTPKNPLHALLGVVELEDSLAEKRHHRQLNEIFTHNLIFGNHQKTQLAKRPNN